MNPPRGKNNQKERVDVWWELNKPKKKKLLGYGDLAGLGGGF